MSDKYDVLLLRDWFARKRCCSSCCNVCATCQWSRDNEYILSSTLSYKAALTYSRVRSSVSYAVKDLWQSLSVQVFISWVHNLATLVWAIGHKFDRSCLYEMGFVVADQWELCQLPLLSHWADPRLVLPRWQPWLQPSYWVCAAWSMPANACFQGLYSRISLPEAIMNGLRFICNISIGVASAPGLSPIDEQDNIGWSIQVLSKAPMRVALSHLQKPQSKAVLPLRVGRLEDGNIGREYQFLWLTETSCRQASSLKCRPWITRLPSKALKVTDCANYGCQSCSVYRMAWSWETQRYTKACLYLQVSAAIACIVVVLRIRYWRTYCRAVRQAYCLSLRCKFRPVHEKWLIFCLENDSV